MLLAARVCLHILRGAANLAQPYAYHLTKLLKEREQEGELAWLEGLTDCLVEVIAKARSGKVSTPMGAREQDDQVSSSEGMLVSEW
jgi:hypothetical protein